jgi:hypothetical protein
MRRASSIVVLFGAITFVAPPASLEPGASDGLVVHEWGTFTSVAGENGHAVDWSTQAGPSDLPCFVERLAFGLKGSLSATVRMETPVIYFYTPRATKVDVGVRFGNGLITEWYPKAAVTPEIGTTNAAMRRPGFEGTIAWENVTISPGGSVDFPRENSPSHYYAARMTDASPIEAGSEKEKFLFYRGVGTFPPPITATVAPDGTIDVKSSKGDALGDIILFDNRGGRIGYEARAGGAREVFAPLIVDGEAEPPLDELAEILVANGLYPKEAKAMIATWRDSWFEEGTRLLYIVPRHEIDTVLPLTIQPRPSETVRVFVGRVELIAPVTLQDVRRALDNHDRATLQKHGRFLQPILSRLGRGRPEAGPAADVIRASETVSTSCH